MKLKYYFNISIIVLSFNIHAFSVFPDVRTMVPVSKADVNQVNCAHGQISSIDYAAGTGLTHKRNANGKSITLLFKQLDNGKTRKIINSQVGVLISCNYEYYYLTLDPRDITGIQLISLQVADFEIKAKKIQKQMKNKSTEQVLIDLIKTYRQKKTNSQQEKQDGFYIDKLQIKLLSKDDIAGTQYQIKKFVVISNNAISLSEKMFIDTKLGNYKIAALSLDDYQLNSDKKYTYLYAVFNR